MTDPPIEDIPMPDTVPKTEQPTEKFALRSRSAMGLFLIFVGGLGMVCRLIGVPIDTTDFLPGLSELGEQGVINLGLFLLASSYVLKDPEGVKLALNLNGTDRLPFFPKLRGKAPTA